MIMRRSRLSRKSGKPIKARMSRVEFAPDGIHYQVIKSGEIGKMYDYFVMNMDIREQMILNPAAKFRLIGEDGERVIGVMKFDRKTREFLPIL